MKNFLKKYFQILKVRNRMSAQVQISQRHLFLSYKDKVTAKTPVPLEDTGFRVFSQFEEDGILLYIFAVIGMGSRTFVEIGADDGVNSNCANLALNFGWSGLFIDGNATSIRRGQRFYKKYPHPWMHKPSFCCAHVTPANINTLIGEHKLSGQIELLSIDIDGDDYWIWEALEVIQPKVVLIETHIRFGYHNIVVPYGRSTQADFAMHHGASPVAMEKLARKKGYRLIGANQLGFNMIFLQEALVSEMLPEKNIKDVLQHPSAQQSMEAYRPDPSLPLVTPID